MKIVIVMVALVTLAACDKLNNLIDVPSKMDSMNEKMNKLTGGMDQTNKTTEQMAKGMDSTVVGINDQRVLLPIKELLDEANYEKLEPIPTLLMPFGKKMSEAISVEDLAELVFLWQKEIREVNPPKDVDANGDDIPYSAEQIKRLNKIKLGRMMAIESICGFLSDAKVAELINTHIKKIGRAHV